jgi:riboflavin synthase
MFTGIIEEVGSVEEVKPSPSGLMIKIGSKTVRGGLALGESVSVNGACLTVADLGDDYFALDVVPETIGRSTLSKLRAGVKVNLERAMKADGRYGGHIVSGHVDGVGRIRRIARRGKAIELEITLPAGLQRYFVKQGSVAVDGVSLTVAEVAGNSITVAIIPFTLASTTLCGKRAGDEVNIEADVLAKYVEKRNRREIDDVYLKEIGFIS